MNFVIGFKFDNQSLRMDLCEWAEPACVGGRKNYSSYLFDIMVYKEIGMHY